MPTYDYRCQGCDHRMEAFQSITEPALRKCPECGRPKLKRLISAGAGFIFKGSGFYITDYRSESYKKAAEGDNGAAKSDAKPSDTAAKSDAGESKAKSDGAATGTGSKDKAAKPAAADSAKASSAAKGRGGKRRVPSSGA